MTSDDRFTGDLIIDIFDVLEQHGYHRYDNQHTGQALLAIIDLAHVYNGTRDAPYDTHLDHAPPGSPAEPGPADPDADDAVILTAAEVTTIADALDLAAVHHRDHAAGCAGCPDQTCPTCQSRLRDARAYDQMATQLLHTAEAARTANATQPEPGSPPDPPRQPPPAADKEAGQ